MERWDEGIGPPRDFYNSTEDWAAAAYPDQKSAAGMYRKCPVEPFRYNPGRFQQPIDPSMWTMYGEPLPYYIAFMPNGRVWGENGAVISPDNKLVWDVSHEMYRLPQEHSVFEQEYLPPVTRLPGTAALLTYVGNSNYFFWMFDVLARMELLRREGIAVDKYLINQKRQPFQDETLAALGVTPDRLIECKSDTHICASNLVITPPVAYSGHVQKWVCDFLRERFAGWRAAASGGKGERLYISRSGARYRHVRNEEEVVALLERHGFTRIHCEEYSVAEQVRLFASAEVIVAPHGAGLANIVFCRPGTKVIEFFSPHWVRQTYWMISCHCDLDYYYLIGRKRKLVYDVWSIRYHIEDDIVVDLKRLAGLLKLAGCA
jgi:capsular polysaccharide biosynthesis protein